MTRLGGATRLIVDAGRVNCPRRGCDITIEVCLSCPRFQGIEPWERGPEEVLRCVPGTPLRRVGRPVIRL